MTSYLPPIPPVVPPPGEMGAEWVKRYLSDQSQFRDVLRRWIVSANACCDSHETRIDALEESYLWDLDEGGASAVYDVGTLDLDEGAAT